MPALMPEIAIRKLLNENGSIDAILDGRINPGFMMESADRPYAVYRRDSTEPDHHMGGVSGLKYISYAITFYAPTYAAATNLAQLAETELDGTHDRTTVSDGGNDIEIARLWLTDQSDEEQLVAGDGKARMVYGIRQLYEMHYQN